MHELSIAAAVVEQVTTRLPGTPVSLVRLRIGTLSGVVPSAVEFCFSLAAAGTTLESAEEPTVRISPHATSLRYGR